MPDVHVEPVSTSHASEAHAADAELVARARTGDQRALNAIYRGHRRAVGRHLLMLTHDASAVDDLVQDTFVTAFSKLEQYTGNSRLGTWLHGIAVNIARNHRSKRTRRRGLFDRFVRPGVTQAASATADAGTREREALAALYRALDELTSDQREAFILRVIEDVPLQDAAEVLGAPIATISYRARQAQARVRQCLQDQGVTA
jgi:RNA polymerase sigma-70 factor (ECF subfamily)